MSSISIYCIISNQTALLLYIGATDPTKAEPGTIRGDLCVQVGRNIIHGSDGVDSASHEIQLWFKPEEIANYSRALDSWISEGN